MVTMRSFTGPTRAGLDHVGVRRDRVDHVPEAALPKVLGKVHAVRSSYRGTEPWFLDRWQYERGLCGVIVKVVLAAGFDPDDPDVCERCADNARAGVQAVYDDRAADRPTAVVAEGSWEERPIYWWHCEACAQNGTDRRDEAQADADARTHNQQVHAGRSRVPRARW